MAGPGNRRYGPACGDSCPRQARRLRAAEERLDNNNGEEENADDDAEDIPVPDNVKEEETRRKRGRVNKRSWTKQQVSDGINKRLPDFSAYVDTQEKNID
eukprot:655196-Heterocapsa_arctica.AAC.1